MASWMERQSTPQVRENGTTQQTGARPENEARPEELSIDRLLAPGAQVEISFTLQGFIKNFRSAVHDLNRETLLVVAPSTRGIPERIPPGTQMSLRVKKAVDAYVALVYAMEVRRPSAGDALPLLVTSRPAKVEKVSPRAFYRVDVDLPCQGETFAGRVINLSGNGCMVVVHEGKMPQAGADMRISLRLPNFTEPIPMEARVVRRFEPEGKAPGRIALETRNIHERSQDLIVRYVFQRQRELMQLGALDLDRRPSR